VQSRGLEKVSLVSMAVGVLGVSVNPSESGSLLNILELPNRTSQSCFSFSDLAETVIRSASNGTRRSDYYIEKAMRNIIGIVLCCGSVIAAVCLWCLE